MVQNKGYGRVSVNGGAGHVYGSYEGGGGSAGRIAVYFALNRTFSGSFEAHGGLSGGQGAGVGGPGTMFFYHTGKRLRKHFHIMLSRDLFLFWNFSKLLLPCKVAGNLIK